MKKLLVLMLVLGITSLANAGLIELKIASLNGEPIDPVSEIWIEPSDVIDLNIYYTAPVGWILCSVSVDIVATGPGTLSNMFNLTEPTGAWDADLTLITENVAGKDYTIEYAMNNGVAGTGSPVIALDDILLHCDAVGTVTITMTDNPGTATGGTVETDWVNMPTPTFGGSVIIHQIPEPATMLLLGLGGLFLRRRK